MNPLHIGLLLIVCVFLTPAYGLDRSKLDGFNAKFSLSYCGTYEADPRIIESMNVFALEAQKRILAAWLLETDLGQVIFDDRQRMHRNLLADPAAKLLQKQG